MTDKVAVFSFFSGIGCLDLGFETEGYSVVYVNEYHKQFMEGYKYSRKKLGISEPLYGCFTGDISECVTRNGAEELAEKVYNARKGFGIIGFIGGPPCPDFSIGGKNRGKFGGNGILSKTYVNLICKQRPDFFLYENVKGLWTTKKHRTFYEELKARLIQSDYALAEKLINCIEFGTPQDRWRIFLIGIRLDIARERGLQVNKKVNTITNFPWYNYVIYPHEKAFSLPWPAPRRFEENSEVRMPRNIPEELTVQHWFNKNIVDKHANAKHHFTPRAGLARFKLIDEGDDSRKSYKRLHRWRYSPTACYGNNEVHLHPYKPRRLSASEALAIQSLPQAFELPSNMTLTDMFKSIGNGVPYLAAKGIAKTIRDTLSDK